MPNLTLYLFLALGAWGVAAPAGVWAWQKVGQQFAVHKADKAARADEQVKCTQRVAKIQKDLADAAAETVKQAADAVAALPPVPGDDDGLRRLCDRSASCRDRRKQ